MAFKIALLLAFGAQLIAAILALRLNFRYRIYSAWFFVSGAALVAAILRLTTLCETWMDPPTFESNWVQWASAFASLCASLMLLGGMSSIEPFFKQMAAAQESLRSENAALETYVKETEEELRLAQRIQRQLLPRSVPEIPNLDIYGQSDPAEWTSGDYFDYLNLRGGGLAVVVADVSGHGLGPALLMSSTRASFRGIAPTTDDVGQLLTAGNRAVADAVSASDFVTAMAVQYNPKTKILAFATAGHAGYLIRADGTCDRLSGESPPLGILPELEVETGFRDHVGEGDILVLVTDGILEASNSSESMFGEERLIESVKRNQDESAESIVRALLAASRDYAGSQPQHDDITAVVVKFAVA